METGDFLRDRPVFTFALLLLLLLLAASELGFRLGRRRALETPPDERSEMATVQAAMLGMLALLLGFTFAMAVTRFDARHALKVVEVNTIRTAAMRGQLLPEPHNTAVVPLFHAYVDTRLEAFVYETQARVVQELETRTHELEAALWQEAVGASRLDEQSTTAGLFVESLNAMIEAREHRQAILYNRVPASVLLLLAIGAVIAMFGVGMGYGFTGRRAIMPRVVLALLISLVVFTIIDLDFPGHGVIRMSDQGLRELRELLP